MKITYFKKIIIITIAGLLSGFLLASVFQFIFSQIWTQSNPFQHIFVTFGSSRNPSMQLQFFTLFIFIVGSTLGAAFTSRYIGHSLPFLPLITVSTISLAIAVAIFNNVQSVFLFTLLLFLPSTLAMVAILGQKRIKPTHMILYATFCVLSVIISVSFLANVLPDHGAYRVKKSCKKEQIVYFSNCGCGYQCVDTVPSSRCHQRCPRQSTPRG